MGRDGGREGEEGKGGDRQPAPQCLSFPRAHASPCSGRRSRPAPARAQQPLPFSPLRPEGPSEKSSQAGSCEEAEKLPNHLLWIKIKRNQIFR